MHYENYSPLHVSSDALEYKFFSSGPKGQICIVVQFVKTDSPDIYNLAFGNLLPDGDIDDLVKNNNNDRNKILATIAAAVYEFTAKYPGKRIYFTGSTPERTRLYRMALSLNLDELDS